MSRALALVLPTLPPLPSKRWQWRVDQRRSSNPLEKCCAWVGLGGTNAFDLKLENIFWLMPVLFGHKRTYFSELLTANAVFHSHMFFSRPYGVFHGHMVLFTAISGFHGDTLEWTMAREEAIKQPSRMRNRKVFFC